jgi:hypothetical protein
MFCCVHCQRQYQRKMYYDRHVIACQFLTQPKRERELDREELDDTPSVRDLYALSLALAAKCRDLEMQLQSMHKQSSTPKFQPIAWLNTTYPAAIDYDKWFAALNVTQADLLLLFETDYVGGVVRFLKQALLAETRPIRILKNSFYIFRHQWHVADNDTFTQLMYLLDKQFMREFISWQTANKNRMMTEDSFTEIYARNLKKVMGGNFTREQLYSRVKKDWLAGGGTPGGDPHTPH